MSRLFPEGGQIVGLAPILPAQHERVSQEHGQAALGLIGVSLAAIAPEAENTELVGLRGTQRDVDEPGVRERPRQVYLRCAEKKIRAARATRSSSWK